MRAQEQKKRSSALRPSMTGASSTDSMPASASASR